MGCSLYDPDVFSKKMKEYHKILWSRQLPNGEYFDLNLRDRPNDLIWKGWIFGCDNITNSFRFNKNIDLINKIKESLIDYRAFMENYSRKAYTIGGSIIFPKMRGSINQMRGLNPYIQDRFDLTLECIRLYYLNKTSPLYSVILKNKSFFDLFVDFKGYVDFFYLQDLVEEKYSIKFWLGFNDFKLCPLPKDVEEYLSCINKQLEFVNKRNC